MRSVMAGPRLAGTGRSADRAADLSEDLVYRSVRGRSRHRAASSAHTVRTVNPTGASARSWRSGPRPAVEIERNYREAVGERLIGPCVFFARLLAFGVGSGGK